MKVRTESEVAQSCLTLSHSAIKKNGILPFAATWVDLEIIILSEVSQTKKDKYYMISLICGGSQVVLVLKNLPSMQET